MTPYHKVILTGFMGSGKSSIGQKLASRWGLPFIDLDVSIEHEHGASIHSLFDEKGEEWFRMVELKKLTELINDSKPFVLSTGGGTLCSMEAQNLVQKELTVYLQLPNNILIGRLRQDRSKRPLISNLSDEELSDFVEKKLAERESFYLKSSLTLNIFDTTIGRIAAEIESQLR